MRDDDIKEPIVTRKEEEKWEEEGGRGAEVKESWSKSKGGVKKINGRRENVSGSIEED